MRRLLTIPLFFATVCFGQTQPGWLPNTTPNWFNAGVQGGIPVRSNIFVNLLTTTNLLYRCDGTGASDVSTNIYNAMRACPSNEVIYAPAGVYRIDSGVSVSQSPIHFTLRGDGWGKTVFAVTTGNPAFSLTGYDPRNLSSDADHRASIKAGAIAGSTNVTINLNLTSYTSVGQFVLLFQQDDGQIVNGYGSYGLGGGGIVDQNNFVHMGVIQAVTSNSITFVPPLDASFNTNLNPKLAAEPAYYGTPSWCGFEDFTITNAAPANLYLGNQNFINLQSTWNCWVKNVEMCNTKAQMMNNAWIVCCTVCDCYMHDNTGGAVGSGIGIQILGGWDCLVQNNIGDYMYQPIVTEFGSGNVIAYNYLVHSVNPNSGVMPASINMHHICYDYMNLAEGNSVNEIQLDDGHGSGGLSTLFRNFLWGSDSGNNLPYTMGQKSISLDAFSLSNNVVGNVLGLSTRRYSGYFEDQSGVNGTQEPCVIRFGFPNEGNSSLVLYGCVKNYGNVTNQLWLDLQVNPFIGGALVNGDYDLRVMPSTFVEGNYDFYHNATIWTNTGTALNNGMTPTNLPPSLYLTSKPSWWTNWGNTPWPPIGPDVVGMTNAIPAQLRFAQLTSASGNGTNSSTQTSPPTNLRVIGH